MTYFYILMGKIIEDALGTLRIILVASGKKVLGAILQFIIALIWIALTSTVIIGLNSDPLKIVFFALGSLIGSYFGSVLEEKIALGYNLLIVKTNNHNMFDGFKKFKINIIKNDDGVLLITLPRKKIKTITSFIKSKDSKAFIALKSINIIH